VARACRLADDFYADFFSRPVLLEWPFIFPFFAIKFRFLLLLLLLEPLKDHSESVFDLNHQSISFAPLFNK